jgi:hypothetical protein
MFVLNKIKLQGLVYNSLQNVLLDTYVPKELVMRNSRPRSAPQKYPFHSLS